MKMFSLLIRRTSSGGVGRAKTMTSTTTVGILIIGDEILKGQTADLNAAFLTPRLHSMGVKVSQISVIPDDVEEIARHVLNFSEKFDVVLTSGGVGPTHDDVTYAGVAKAFNDTLAPNPQILELVRRWFKLSSDVELETHPAVKLAMIPSKATLNYGGGGAGSSSATTTYPVISLHNVYVFPGIPSLLQRAFLNLAGPVIFANKNKSKFFVRELYTELDEVSITPILDLFVDRYPTLVFGSYPELKHLYYRTKITIESSESRELVDNVYSEMAKEIPKTLSNFDKDPTKDSMMKILRLLDRPDLSDEFKADIKEALGALEKCFTDYKPKEIFICFNGGKDCIVMLHLVHAYVRSHFDPDATEIQAMYIREAQPFPEVESFIEKISEEYDLKITTLSGKMKPALRKLLDDNPEAKAMILGTRNTDPGCENLELFSLTDGDWPEVMRVHPVLHWTYAHIWTFIRKLNLPYPFLYNEGYTSLGGMDKTKPNPALRVTDDNGKVEYRPAYLLEDGSLERAGRD